MKLRVVYKISYFADGKFDQFMIKIDIVSQLDIAKLFLGIVKENAKEASW